MDIMYFLMEMHTTTYDVFLPKNLNLNQGSLYIYQFTENKRKQEFAKCHHKNAIHRNAAKS